MIKPQHIILTLMSAMLLTLLASCTLETSDNGDFDGFWHLEQVDTLATGKSANLSNRRVFWGVQYKLINVRDVDVDGALGYYLRFTQTAGDITTYSPYKNGWHEDSANGGDTPISDAKLLAPYGINNIEEHFVKERLTGHTMILVSPTLRLHFRKQ